MTVSIVQTDTKVEKEWGGQNLQERSPGCCSDTWKQNKTKQNNKATAVAHTSFCLLRDPMWFSRETHPKMWAKLLQFEECTSVRTKGSFAAEEVLNCRRLSEHKIRIKGLCKTFGSLCTVSKEYHAFYLHSCQTSPSKGAVVEKWIQMLLKTHSVFC